jgi:hypothetical protein
MACGVGGDTALLWVVCVLRCEFGVKSDDVVCCATLCGVALFRTLRGETVICTLGGASLPTVSAGGSRLLICAIVWHPRRYQPNVSMLTFAYHRPYKMVPLAADAIVYG